MVEGVGSGNDVADFIVGSGAGVVESICLTDLSSEIVVTVAGGKIESIGEAQDIANFVVGDLRQTIFSILDLDAAIEGVVGVFCPIAVGIDGG
jgi:hypothetical protein